LGSKGVSKARNFGASKAQGEVLVFEDADAIVPENILNDIAETFTDSSVAGAVSYVLPRKREILSASEKLFFELDAFFIRKIAICSGVFLRFYTRGDVIAARKENFFKVGGFDEKLNCMEITDLLEKLAKSGLIKVLNVPVFESSRRIKRYGLVKTYLIWWRNFLSFFVLKKPFSATWEPVR
jgi:glycosyltransferase involved in cell wall biosynthesis